MPVENVTASRSYQLPNGANRQKDDVLRLIAAFNAIDADVATLFTDLGTKIGANSPAFTGTPTAPTPTAGDSSGKLATTAYVVTAIAALIDSSPAALDTLNELAAALADDPNFATTMTNALALKASVADMNAGLASKLAIAQNLADVASKPTAIANLRYAPRAVTSASSSGDRTFAATDIGRVLIVNGTAAAAVALTLPDPATLPDGWSTFVKVPGDVIATITPASGTIDGAASLKMRFNQECMIYKDGSVYRTHGLQRRVRLALQKLTVAADEVVFTLPLSWRSFEMDWEARHASGASTEMFAQFSSDGGANYVDGASDYTYSFGLVTGSAATNGTQNTSGAAMGFLSQNYAAPEKVSFTLTDQSPLTQTLHVRGRNHYWLGAAYGMIGWTSSSNAVSQASDTMKLINPVADFVIGSYFDLYGVNEA